MSKQGDSVPNEAIQSNSPEAGRIEVQVDDQSANVYYSTTSRVWGSAEEIYIDLGGTLKPAGEGKAVMKVDQRTIFSPWGAKRLAMALAQVVNNYESTYGTLEIDQRKRAQSQAGDKA